MAIGVENKIFFSQIVQSLEQLTKRAGNSNHGQYFQRLTLNHRILAELQARIYKRNLSKDDVSDSELLMLRRGTVFNWSSLRSSIDFFRWSRASTVQELASQAYQSAKENSLLVSITALRSILEISGNAALLEKDLRQLAEPKDENVARMDWLSDFESVIDGRIAGVRVDYSSLIRDGLRGTKRLSYKPGEFEADHTAKDLLKGVDVLDKRIKGARAAYEFFSEFAHPNLASVWTNYDRMEVKIRVLDIYGYAAHHQRRHVGAAFLDTFGSVVNEGIEIAGECVDELLRIDLVLEAEGEAMARHAKKAIREIIKRHPAAFDSRELCPCNSGKNIQQCCGKLIKVSRFGRWTTTPPLH
jgi:hypothetical protein